MAFSAAVCRSSKKKNMERVMGFEPTAYGLEADALPLSYTRMDACWCAKPWTHEAPVFLPIVSEG